jgi:hypothetical protein
MLRALCELGVLDMPAELRAKYQYSTAASMERLLRESGYGWPITPLIDAVRVYDTLCPTAGLGDEAAG